MFNDVTRFPVKTWERIKNRRGKRSVSCIVTDRWLRFSEHADQISAGTVVFVDVMTDAGEGERKLCELCIPLEELAEAVKNIEIKK
ncbi:hypothetical protein [Tateyamaria sp.]|uniref:hypothetical protein n=1 Tax=Tateyamaria sp. TaxID=1929288 RepID=UPI00329AFA5D